MRIVASLQLLLGIAAWCRTDARRVLVIFYETAILVHVGSDLLKLRVLGYLLETLLGVQLLLLLLLSLEHLLVDVRAGGCLHLRLVS